MRLIHSAPGAERPQDAWLTELDAALDGDAHGPAAESWRELRSDVRALTPPIEPAFEQALRERLAAASHESQKRTPRLGRRAGKQDERRSRPRLHLPRHLDPRQLHPRHLDPRAPLLVATLAAIVVALVLVAPWHSSGGTSSSSGSAETAGDSVGAQSGASLARHPSPLGKSSSASAGQAAAPEATESGASGRLQQLASSITLRATPSDVQATSDRVTRLAATEGGFVQSAHVEASRGHRSEAELVLHVPSAKLGATLAALERIAPVSAESQSLQDITAAHNDARHRLAEVRSQRQTLLHSLSQASSEEEAEALQRRLARVGRQISNAEASLHAIARRASTAEVEVSIVGAAHAGGSGLTLDRGLHDALRVLTVMLIVLLLAAAVLLPLALALAASLAGLRAWRRYRRESALDAS